MTPPEKISRDEAVQRLTALTDDCCGSCAHEGIHGECLCTSVFFPAIEALRGDAQSDLGMNAGATTS